MTRRSNGKEKEITEPVAENMVQLVVEEGKKIAKEDFGKFSAIVAVIFSIGLWLVKGIWYTYMLGKLSVYKIDKCYIHADNENILLEIMHLGAILIIWFLINYMYYKISVAEDKSRFSWRKKIKKLSFWGVEMLLCLAWVLFCANSGFWELFGEISVVKVIALLVLLLLLCFLINIYAIELLYERGRKKKSNKRENNQKNQVEIKKETQIKNMLLTTAVVIAIESMIVFFAAYLIECNRCAYKLIMVQRETDAENEYIIKYGMDHNEYEMYPVAYEDEHCYIITRLFNDNGKICIDYNYQKIIEKEGQETRYIQNVYNIVLGK